jgi:hypothetical protein
MAQKYPDYPKTTNIDKAHVAYCFDQTKPKGKREEADTASNSSSLPEPDELVYEPEEKGALQARGFVDKIVVAGKDLFLAPKPTCSAPEVPDNFMWVEDVIAKAGDVCERIKADIVMTGAARDGGVGYVLDLLNNGHDKQGHQLKDNRWVYATYFLRFVPPAKATIDEIQSISAGIYDLCNDGIERILTKGDGCTQSIKYYRPSKARHYTGDGARSGNLNLYWGDAPEPVAELMVDFTN